MTQTKGVRIRMRCLSIRALERERDENEAHTRAPG